MRRRQRTAGVGRGGGSAFPTLLAVIFTPPASHVKRLPKQMLMTGRKTKSRNGSRSGRSEQQRESEISPAGG